MMVNAANDVVVEILLMDIQNVKLLNNTVKYVHLLFSVTLWLLCMILIEHSMRRDPWQNL